MTVGDREQTWCRRGAENITGADVVRISRTLAIEPWRFTQTRPAAADDPGGVVVQAGRRRVALTLANSVHGCVFLLPMASGAAWCGLGEMAPRSCHAHPADLAAADGDDTEELLAWRADRAHWHELVARWNARSAAAKPEPTMQDFQRYALEAQHARDAGAPWPEEVVG